MPPPFLLGDGEREEEDRRHRQMLTPTPTTHDLLDAAAFNRGSINSATDAGHAIAAEAVASTTRTIRSGVVVAEVVASASFFFAGGVGAVLLVLAIRLSSLFPFAFICFLGKRDQREAKRGGEGEEGRGREKETSGALW